MKADIQFQRGLSLAALGHHNEAVNAFTRALEINPGYTDAIYHKGLSLAELGEFNEAIAALSRALEVTPTIAQCMAD